MTRETAAPPPPPTGQSAVAAALGAYAIWGVFPLLVSPLETVDLGEFVACRALFCGLLLAGILWAKGELAGAVALARGYGGKLTVSALLIGVNWCAYFWGVQHHRIVEAALGYLIVPLLNTAMGALFLKERQNPWQWAGVTMGGLAVLARLSGSWEHLDTVPWLSLLIALSFSSYGLARKLIPEAKSLPGLAVETWALTPLALGYLLWLASRGETALGHASVFQQSLLVATGGITALPLLLWGYAARGLKLTTMGVLQYFSPVMQMLIATLMFSETFHPDQIVMFGLLVAALALYTYGSLRGNAKA